MFTPHPCSKRDRTPRWVKAAAAFAVSALLAGQATPVLAHGGSDSGRHHGPEASNDEYEQIFTQFHLPAPSLNATHLQSTPMEDPDVITDGEGGQWRCEQVSYRDLDPTITDPEDQYGKPYWQNLYPDIDRQDLDAENRGHNPPTVNPCTRLADGDSGAAEREVVERQLIWYEGWDGEADWPGGIHKDNTMLTWPQAMEVLGRFDNNASYTKRHHPNRRANDNWPNSMRSWWQHYCLADDALNRVDYFKHVRDYAREHSQGNEAYAFPDYLAGFYEGGEFRRGPATTRPARHLPG